MAVTPAATYSFSDVYINMNFQGLASIVLNGQGVGEISIEAGGDVTRHDIGADGVVMPSKLANNTATCTITVQQTSRVHTALLAAYNYLYNQPSDQWIANEINISTLPTSFGMKDLHKLTGVSFSRRANQPYQAEGQRVSWQFMVVNWDNFAPLTAAPLANETISGSII